MFERFAPSAREAVVMAREEAAGVGTAWIGTEHLLLGSLRVDSGGAARSLDLMGIALADVRADVLSSVAADRGETDAEVLRSIGIDLEEVRRSVEEAFGPGALDRPSRRPSARCSDPSGARVPFTPRAKKVLQLALREARALGHDSIETEHVLLGLVRERSGRAYEILEARGATDRRVRLAVLAELERGAPGRSA
jgi:ATP-dependent Clp protease ATP-binding subunit ClpA